jgi:hypothetical protein
MTVIHRLGQGIGNPCSDPDHRRFLEPQLHRDRIGGFTPRSLSFFAKPYHSWERGLNEHTNGLFIQYFPKGSNLSIVSDTDIQRVEDKLNSRPQKDTWLPNSS